MSRSLAYILTLVVGGLVAVQPPANAALARHVGDLGAAFVSSTISLAVIGVLLLAVGDPSRLSGLSAFTPANALGGLGGAAVVGVSLITIRQLGTGGVIALLVAAQLVISVIADRLQWFGVHEVELSVGRLAGLALVIAGTLLITRS